MKEKELSFKIMQEETLDPDDWDMMRTTGSQMVDDMILFLQNIRRQPVWRKPPEEVKEHFKATLPHTSQPFGEVYEEFKTHILPYYTGNIHPRFWSWVMGTGTAQSMLAEMLAAGMNCNVCIGDQSPMYVDQQVINWCKEMIGFPKESSGMLVSGASAANLNALVVARNSVNKYIRSRGLQIYTSKLVMYASAETHSSVQKAAEIMGIGSGGVRKVRVDHLYKMDMNHLEELIHKDRSSGNIPFCVVANVGTVNTGAIDPLEEIFLVCMKYNLWFHIDAAFGALTKLLPEYQEKLKCLELADSIAFDLHKWMYMPYEAGVVLVKNADTHRDTYALQPDYILNHERGIAAGPELTSNFGFDLSRNFKALKVWMALKEHGIDKFKRLIGQNIQQARYLEGLVRREASLELMAPVSMNIVCFRYNPGLLMKWELNKLNKEILMRIQEEGIAAPSYTKLNDEYCLRVAITNHRSIQNDFDVLVKEVLRIGNSLEKEMAEGPGEKKKKVA
ncbi:MAG TPA: aminotransferase class V-fold PLP-dependent enzyme [Chitinophagaceae bacterium]